MQDLFGNEIDDTIPSNIKSHFTTIGARNYAQEERQTEDFYATEPRSVYELLEKESFKKTILEPCVGMGHIATVLENCGYSVIPQDIVDRGYPNTKIINFFSLSKNEYDIVTNPPFVIAKDFVEHALEISPNETKIAMLLKLTFLEGIERKKLFTKYPFKTLWVHSQRRNCAKNGDFVKYSSSAIAYGWYVWEKGYIGDSLVKWI